MPPPSHRQQAKQSPVWRHLSQVLHGAHWRVEPLQVTLPGCPTEQLRSTAEQEVVLPEQQRVLMPQFAQQVTVVETFFAVQGAVSCCAAQLPAGGLLRIEARASRARGAWLGAWANAATEMRRAQAKNRAFFTDSSFLTLRCGGFRISARCVISSAFKGGNTLAGLNESEGERAGTARFPSSRPPGLAAYRYVTIFVCSFSFAAAAPILLRAPPPGQQSTIGSRVVWRCSG